MIKFMMDFACLISLNQLNEVIEISQIYVAICYFQTNSSWPNFARIFRLFLIPSNRNESNLITTNIWSNWALAIYSLSEPYFNRLSFYIWIPYESLFFWFLLAVLSSQCMWANRNRTCRNRVLCILLLHLHMTHYYSKFNAILTFISLFLCIRDALHA